MFGSFSGAKNAVLSFSVGLCCVVCCCLSFSGFSERCCVLSVLHFACVWVHACVVLFSLSGTHISLLYVAFVVSIG